jgi:hypothetical protein
MIKYSLNWLLIYQKRSALDRARLIFLEFMNKTYFVHGMTIKVRKTYKALEYI